VLVSEAGGGVLDLPRRDLGNVDVSADEIDPRSRRVRVREEPDPVDLGCLDEALVRT
jgi:hypothetical protein